MEPPPSESDKEGSKTAEAPPVVAENKVNHPVALDNDFQSPNGFHFPSFFSLRDVKAGDWMNLIHMFFSLHFSFFMKKVIEYKEPKDIFAAIDCGTVDEIVLPLLVGSFSSLEILEASFQLKAQQAHVRRIHMKKEAGEFSSRDFFDFLKNNVTEMKIQNFQGIVVDSESSGQEWPMLMNEAKFRIMERKEVIIECQKIGIGGLTLSNGVKIEIIPPSPLEKRMNVSFSCGNIEWKIDSQEVSLKSFENLRKSVENTLRRLLAAVTGSSSKEEIEDFMVTGSAEKIETVIRLPNSKTKLIFEGTHFDLKLSCEKFSLTSLHLELLGFQGFYSVSCSKALEHLKNSTGYSNPNHSTKISMMEVLDSQVDCSQNQYEWLKTFDPKSNCYTFSHFKPNSISQSKPQNEKIRFSWERNSSSSISIPPVSLTLLNFGQHKESESFCCLDPNKKENGDIMGESLKESLLLGDFFGRILPQVSQKLTVECKLIHLAYLPWANMLECPLHKEELDISSLGDSNLEEDPQLIIAIDDLKINRGRSLELGPQVDKDAIEVGFGHLWIKSVHRDFDQPCNLLGEFNERQALRIYDLVTFSPQNKAKMNCMRIHRVNTEEDASSPELKRSKPFLKNFSLFGEKKGLDNVGFDSAQKKGNMNGEVYEMQTESWESWIASQVQKDKEGENDSKGLIKIIADIGSAVFQFPDEEFLVLATGNLDFSKPAWPSSAIESMRKLSELVFRLFLGSDAEMESFGNIDFHVKSGEIKMKVLKTPGKLVSLPNQSTNKTGPEESDHQEELQIEALDASVFGKNSLSWSIALEQAVENSSKKFAFQKPEIFLELAFQKAGVEWSFGSGLFRIACESGCGFTSSADFLPGFPPTNQRKSSMTETNFNDASQKEKSQCYFWTVEDTIRKAFLTKKAGVELHKIDDFFERERFLVPSEEFKEENPRHSQSWIAQEPNNQIKMKIANEGQEMVQKTRRSSFVELSETKTRSKITFNQAKSELTPLLAPSQTKDHQATEHLNRTCISLFDPTPIPSAEFSQTNSSNIYKSLLSLEKASFFLQFNFTQKELGVGFQNSVLVPDVISAIWAHVQSGFAQSFPRPPSNLPKDLPKSSVSFSQTNSTMAIKKVMSSFSLIVSNCLLDVRPFASLEYSPGRNYYKTNRGALLMERFSAFYSDHFTFSASQLFYYFGPYKNQNLVFFGDSRLSEEAKKTATFTQLLGILQMKKVFYVSEVAFTQNALDIQSIIGKLGIPNISAIVEHFGVILADFRELFLWHPLFTSGTSPRSTNVAIENLLDEEGKEKEEEVKSNSSCSEDEEVMNIDSEIRELKMKLEEIFKEQDRALFETERKIEERNLEQRKKKIEGKKAQRQNSKEKNEALSRLLVTSLADKPEGGGGSSSNEASQETEELRIHFKNAKMEISSQDTFHELLETKGKPEQVLVFNSKHLVYSKTKSKRTENYKLQLWKLSVFDKETSNVYFEFKPSLRPAFLFAFTKITQANGDTHVRARVVPRDLVVRDSEQIKGVIGKLKESLSSIGDLVVLPVVADQNDQLSELEPWENKKNSYLYYTRRSGEKSAESSKLMGVPKSQKGNKVILDFMRVESFKTTVIKNRLQNLGESSIEQNISQMTRWEMDMTVVVNKVGLFQAILAEMSPTPNSPSALEFGMTLPLIGSVIEVASAFKEAYNEKGLWAKMNRVQTRIIQEGNTIAKMGKNTGKSVFHAGKVMAKYMQPAILYLYDQNQATW